MTLRNSTPIAWRPRGLTDCLDSTQSIPGSMATLQNLIPDPTTMGLWQCRPASVELLNFNAPGGPFSSGFDSGFQHSYFPGGASAGQITCFLIVGDIAYGLLSGPSGFDYPFAFDLVNNVLNFVTNGQDTSKMPVTQPQTGAWTPPSMAVVGTEVLVTHPGFLGGGSNIYFGWFNISNPSAPVWNAGNLTGAVQFVFPPTYVAAFNGRAYWLSNPPTGQPAAVFSDILLPRTVTNATQVITFDDRVFLRALAPLPLKNQLGGVIQALMVFKDNLTIFQISGDAASTTDPLSKNALNIATSTNGPSSIASTPKGLAFAAPDGVRVIDFTAEVSEPLGWEGQGKVLPFLFSGEPTRVVSASTGTLFRITVKDTTLIGAPYVDYWFDIVRGVWSGPHTFPANWVQPYKNSFIMSARDVPAKLFRSDPQQMSTSTYVENGTQLQWVYTTSFLPDTDEMAENSMVETTLTMAMQTNVTYPIECLGPSGDIFGQANIFIQSATPLWGTAVWGSFTWGGQQGVLFPRPIPWTAPVVFRRMQLRANGPSDGQVKLSTWHCRYEQLGYLQQSLVA